jgi:hypothetical protein
MNESTLFIIYYCSPARPLLRFLFLFVVNVVVSSWRWCPKSTDSNSNVVAIATLLGLLPGIGCREDQNLASGHWVNSVLIKQTVREDSSDFAGCHVVHHSCVVQIDMRCRTYV